MADHGALRPGQGGDEGQADAAAPRAAGIRSASEGAEQRAARGGSDPGPWSVTESVGFPPSGSRAIWMERSAEPAAVPLGVVQQVLQDLVQRVRIERARGRSGSKASPMRPPSLQGGPQPLDAVAHRCGQVALRRVDDRLATLEPRDASMFVTTRPSRRASSAMRRAYSPARAGSPVPSASISPNNCMPASGVRNSWAAAAAKRARSAASRSVRRTSSTTAQPASSAASDPKEKVA